MRVLITNDDGIEAPGLDVLEHIAGAVSKDVWVVAPETDQSGASHSLTLAEPLRMYFLMIRPQQKRLKDHQAMIAAIRRGDTVVTSGGILGKVTKVDDQELQVEIADGVRVKVVRGTVSEVRGKGEAQPAPKSKAAAEDDK